MEPKLLSVETRPPCAGAPAVAVGHEPTNVLAVFSSVVDELILEKMLQSISCKRLWARSAGEAIRILEQTPISVVMCEQQLPDGDWRLILEATQASPDPPLLVVVSRGADEWLWAEVLNCCGFDVLAKPFRQDEVLNCLNCACRTRNRRNNACARRATA